MMIATLLAASLLPAAPLPERLRVPAHDPLAADLAPFPPRAAVRSWLGFQRGHSDRLAFMAENGWSWEAADAWADQQERTRCWDDLDTAQCAWLGEGLRREALGRLRRALGAADFAAGRMPEPVDPRAFSRAD